MGKKVVALWSGITCPCLIIEAKTGIVYENQTAGCGCFHPRMEGWVFPLDIGRIRLSLRDKKGESPDARLERREKEEKETRKLFDPARNYLKFKLDRNFKERVIRLLKGTTIFEQDGVDVNRDDVSVRIKKARILGFQEALKHKLGVKYLEMIKGIQNDWEAWVPHLFLRPREDKGMNACCLQPRIVPSIQHHTVSWLFFNSSNE